MISFMVFSVVLTLVELLVLCAGSTVGREFFSPVSLAGVGIAMACTEMLQGMSTPRKPGHHLGFCSLSESSAVVKNTLW